MRNDANNVETNGRPPDISNKVECPGCTVTVEAISDIVELSVSGQIRAENMPQIVEAIAKTLKHHQKPRLVDVRDAKGRLGIAETYFFVRSHNLKWRGVRTALVDLPENASYAAFHETTATNAGRILRYFNTLEEARAWLRE